DGHRLLTLGAVRILAGDQLRPSRLRRTATSRAGAGLAAFARFAVVDGMAAAVTAAIAIAPAVVALGESRGGLERKREERLQIDRQGSESQRRCRTDQNMPSACHG